MNATGQSRTEPVRRDDNGDHGTFSDSVISCGASETRCNSPTQLTKDRLEDQTVMGSSAAIVSAALRIAVA
jgi:hypothetical protein